MIKEIQTHFYGWRVNKQFELTASAQKVRVWGKPLSLKSVAEALTEIKVAEVAGKIDTLRKELERLFEKLQIEESQGIKNGPAYKAWAAKEKEWDKLFQKNRKKIQADWWSDLGEAGQQTYLEEHPDSEKAKEARAKQAKQGGEDKAEKKPAKKEKEDKGREKDVDAKLAHRERVRHIEEKVGLKDHSSEEGHHKFEMHGHDPEELLEKFEGVGAKVTDTEKKDGSTYWNLVTEDHHVIQVQHGPDGEVFVTVSEEPNEDVANEQRDKNPEMKKARQQEGEKNIEKHADELKKHHEDLKRSTEEHSPVEKIDEEHREQVVSILEKLKQMTDEAKDKGGRAPNFDLCQVSVPGTNLFCEVNKGIPRDKMPQLKGNPTPGSKAEKLIKDHKGEVNGEDAFKDALKEQGVKMEKKAIDASKLKSTQSQLVGAKVAGMMAALKKDPNHAAIRAPIFVSKDNYILDGHHRWAAVVGYSLSKGEAVPMDVIQVDMSAEELVDFTNKFADKLGIEQKGA